MTDAGPTRSGETRRVAPRSPRAALEPEYVPEPKRPSRRARHPLVIAGNAIFTIILVVAIGAGGVYSFGKQKFDAPGPLEREKVVNIPRGLGLREIADLLARENVIEQPWVFIGGVLVLKAREDLKYGEYKFGKQITLARDDRDDRRRQGRAARLHDSRRADLGADRRAARRGRFPRRQYPRDSQRGHAAAGDLQLPARHDARAGDPAHAAGARPRAEGDLGPAQQPRCRCRHRKRSSRSPRSSRRKPAARTSARASPRCS